VNDIRNKLNSLPSTIITITSINITITHPSQHEIYQVLLNTHKKKNASKQYGDDLLPFQPMNKIPISQFT
jgi:hypothetical protein